MACPYFFPVVKFEDKAWAKPPRLPLGDPYAGVCCVDPLREWRPDETTLREYCNRGYARKNCSRFPEDAEADAVRFAVTKDQDVVVTIYYVLEKDRRPVEHGSLEYSTETRRFTSDDASGLLLKQAQAYVESYLRRKSQPDSEARNPHRR